MKFLFIASLLVALTACGAQSSAQPSTDTAVKVDEGTPPTGAQLMQVIDSITSCFENSTKTIQYGYVEALNDGRGYTAGKAGFTTGTGDLGRGG